MHIAITAIDFQRQNPHSCSGGLRRDALVVLCGGWRRPRPVQIHIVAQCTSPSADQDDRVIAARVGPHLRDQHIPVPLVDEFRDAQALMALFQQMAVVIGTRMHSGILALAVGVPPVSIGYQPKTQGMMEMVGLPNYVLPIEAISAAELLHTSMNCCNNSLSLWLPSRNESIMRLQLDELDQHPDAFQSQPIRVLQIISGLDIGRLSGGAKYFAVRLTLGLHLHAFTAPSTCNPGMKSGAGSGMARAASASDVADVSCAVNAKLTGGATPELSTRPDSSPENNRRCKPRRSDQSVGKVHARSPSAQCALSTSTNSGRRIPGLGQLLSTAMHRLRFRCTDRRIRYNPGDPGKSGAGASVSSARAGHLQRDRRRSAAHAASHDARCAMSQHPLLPVSIRRLTEQKGFGYLLDAMPRVLADRPAHLLLIGAGPLEQNLRAQAKSLALEDDVEFLGWRPDVLALLPHADLFVSASLWEGLPTVVLEAMASRLPVIATCVSGSESVHDRRAGCWLPLGGPSRLRLPSTGQSSTRIRCSTSPRSPIFHCPALPLTTQLHNSLRSFPPDAQRNTHSVNTATQKWVSRT